MRGVLISDMDMIPLNRSYYVDPIQNIPDDHFITYRDVCLPYGEIAICYSIAHPNIWKYMIGDSSMEALLREWHTNTVYTGIHGGTGWGTDQQVLYKKFNSWNGPKIKLNDSITKYNRLDRIHPHKFTNLSVLKNDIFTGKYSDYHCIRPYAAYKQLNDFVVSCLP